MKDEQVISLRISPTILYIYKTIFRSNWGWKTQLTHMIMAVMALRLDHDLKKQTQDVYFSHTASVIHSTLRFIAGASPRAHKLVAELSKDSFSLLSRGRAKEAIRKAYADFVPSLETEVNFDILGTDEDELIEEVEL